MLLPPDEYALATTGAIAPALRQRSAVYYWSHGAPESAQRQARHEAMCSKKGGWHLRSFGSHAVWAKAAKEKCGPPNSGIHPSTEAGVIDTCAGLSLADLPADWRQAHGVDNRTRGAGWWRWKPYYLLSELRKLPHGDVMVHVDYDLILSKRLPALWCLGQQNPQGVALFHFPCLTDRAWTKRETAVAMGATDAMLDTATLYAGLVVRRRTAPSAVLRAAPPHKLTLDSDVPLRIVRARRAYLPPTGSPLHSEFTPPPQVLRRTAEAESFLQEWLDWTLQDGLATDTLTAPQDAAFRQHRHDQAILSLVAKRRHLKSYPFPTAQHDVRDVWAWEAGYCQPGFDWPLPNYRPYVFSPAWPRGVYISHYKEMGRMKESVRHCLAQQPGTPHLPLPDYVGSQGALDEERAIQRLRDAVQAGAVAGEGFSRRKRRRARQAARGGQEAPVYEEQEWSPVALAAASPQPGGVALVRQERRDAETRAGLAACEWGVNFGGFYYEKRPYLWLSDFCRGVFTCAGVKLRCGEFGGRTFDSELAARGKGIGRLVACPCDEHESLLDGRHLHDGADSVAARAGEVGVVYRKGERGMSGGAA